jgi:hypothetical protein
MSTQVTLDEKKFYVVCIGLLFAINRYGRFLGGNEPAMLK